MSWRRGEVWLESEVLWFRERSAEAASALAAPLRFGLVPEPATAGPVPNGLAASRRRRAELRRRRSARKTRTAALVLGPAVALTLAGSRVGAGTKGGGALEEDPPSLTLRLAPGAAAAAQARAQSAAPRPPAPPAEQREQAPAGEAWPTIEWGRATSHGLPYSGSLSGGTQLPVEGPGWVTWSPLRDSRPNAANRLYGHERTIRAIVSVLAGYRAANPDAPRVVIGDISMRDGGPMLEHRSHQNGLDVDVYYPRLDRALRAPFSSDQVDRALAQDLLDRFLAAGARMVFVGYATGLRGPSGVVVPYPHHENHMHVRFGDPS
jgi:murein endopeptidase